VTALEPRVLPDVHIDQAAPIKHCGTCGAEIWWGWTANQRRNPFDVQGGVRTAITHWSTCLRPPGRKARAA